ncbi:MAG: hypothetical protein ACI84K_000765 [Pseudohongiellaceae bacterium]
MKQSEESTRHNLNDIQTIAQQLRVPELSYRMANIEELSDEIQSFFRDLTYLQSDDNTESVIKNVSGALGKTVLPVMLNNYAFISDRVYDVWGRKNKLSDDINQILKTWRHPFFKIMHQTNNLALLKSFITLVDRISSDTLGWEPRPERSKRIILDELNEITTLLFQLDCENEQSLHLLLARWQSFIEKQSNKALKVIQRLKLLESRQSWDEYCELYAKKYLNTLFSGQLITESLQGFLSDCWLNVLAQGVDKQLNPSVNEDIQTLTAKIKAVFCTKGRAAFKWVDNLSEDIQAHCLKQNIVVSEELWEGVQSDLVNILQGNLLEERQFINSTVPEGWTKPKKRVLNNHVVEGSWFYLVKDDLESREQVIAIFPEAQEVLFCNYLGIKSQRYTFTELNLALSSQVLKPLVADSTFLEVVQKTSTGLLKVAKTQKKARTIAAEKAQKEAENLLAEKQNAEKMAIIKAVKIAEQTKLLRQKRIDKQRAEQERNALMLVTNCKLGAWVSIAQHGDEPGNKPQRFKLVVKFAASSKYIFVDKLGVKKIQYTEADLVAGILTKDIEILSDGLEFEESLERVVSRLRTSK